MMMDRYKAYAITNIATDQSYIGITSRSLLRRWSDHLSASRRGDNSALYNAMRKYGSENFTITHVATAMDYPALKSLETALIVQWGTHRSAKGYNLTFGGDGNLGWVPSAETREKIRQKAIRTMADPLRRAHLSALAKAQMADPQMIAMLKNIDRSYIRTPEYRAKMSVAMTGRTVTREAAAKTAAALRGRKRPASVGEKISKAKKGVPLSEEAKRSLSASTKGVPKSEVFCAALSASWDRRLTESGRLKGAWPHRGKWTSAYWHKGRSIIVGTFDSELDAHLASVAAKQARLTCSGS